MDKLLAAAFLVAQQPAGEDASRQAADVAPIIHTRQNQADYKGEHSPNKHLAEDCAAKGSPAAAAVIQQGAEQSHYCP